MLVLQAVCVVAGILCCFMADVAVGGFVLRVQLHSYHNPLHYDTEGDLCDSGPFDTRACENKFEFCLMRRSSSTCLYRMASSSYYADDDFIFTSSIISQLGLTNPLVFTNVPNARLRLQIRVIDHDFFTPDDLVDVINVNFNAPRTLVRAAFTAPQSYRGINGVSTMQISYQVTETTPTTEATTPTTRPSTAATIPTTRPSTAATTPTTRPSTAATTPTTEAATPNTETTTHTTEVSTPTTDSEVSTPTTEATNPDPSLRTNIIIDNSKPPETAGGTSVITISGVGGAILLVVAGVAVVIGCYCVGPYIYNGIIKGVATPV